MNKKVVLIITIFIISFIVIFGFLYYLLFRSQTDLKLGKVIITGNSFNVEIADTFTTRARGLSGHAPLKDSEGMLFIFPVSAPYGFWMKGMTFPLDMVWINDGKVIGISENVPAPTSALSIATATPPSAVNMVLEINAGESKKLGISTGDKVTTVN